MAGTSARTRPAVRRGASFAGADTGELARAHRPCDACGRSISAGDAEEVDDLLDVLGLAGGADRQIVARSIRRLAAEAHHAVTGFDLDVSRVLADLLAQRL